MVHLSRNTDGLNIDRSTPIMKEEAAAKVASRIMKPSYGR